MSAHELITNHLDLWTQAVTQKSTAGRGSNGKIELTGIKKLRELILQLAVEGKLVQQDSSHKPSSELLQAAADEKARALKDKKIRKSQLGDPGSVIPGSDVPEGWAFTTLSVIGYWAIGNGFPKAHQGETGLEVLFCKVSDMNLPENSREIHTTVNSVSEQTAHSLKLNIHCSGTVIFPKIGGAISTNKRRVIIKPTAIDNNCLGVTPTCAISSGYLYLLLTSVDMTQYQVGTSVPALSQGTLGKIPVKLPPLEEQHRIVQKVDELMALCDRLEQHTSDQLDAHQTLVDTLLSTLTQSANATELADNWARLAEHFDTLFTTEQSINKLKQTILQLAVMGRLVEQDAEDEPAETIVQKLNSKKQELIESGDLRQPKPLPVIEEQDLPFELPDNWKFVRLGSCVRLRSGTTFPRERERSNGRYPYCKVGDMNMLGNAKYITTSSRFIDPTPKEHLHLIPPNSIVFPKRGGAIATNKKRLIQSPVFVDLNVMAMTPYQGVSLEYLLCWLETIDLATLNSGTSVPQINNKDIEPLIFPLPPFHCQQKIVLKVKELMALCEHLKQRLNQASETRNQLAEAVVEGALS